MSLCQLLEGFSKDLNKLFKFMFNRGRDGQMQSNFEAFDSVTSQNATKGNTTPPTAEPLVLQSY